jgi:hypothetical protein
MWKSGLLLARFPRGSWEEWEACFLAFHAFHSPGISIAPRLPGCRPGRSGLSALLHLSHCLLLASATHKSCYRSIETKHLGPMKMTPAVRISLLVLRGYLVLMMLLVLYHVLDLAGVFSKA